MDAPPPELPPVRDVRALVEALAAQFAADAQISPFNWETGRAIDMSLALALAQHARLLELAIEVGIAARQAPLPEDALAALRAVIHEEESFRVRLWDGVWEGLRDYGYDRGYFYGGPHWPSLVRLCSALVFVDELAGLPRTADTQDFVEHMSFLAPELCEPSELTVPPGMPDDHWWWSRWRPAPLPPRGA